MNAAIVVSSCDFFEDCWAPFIHSISKYWSDCKWPIYIISNSKQIATPNGVYFVQVGEDKKFASNLKSALSRINADYIIYLQEDYFLNQNVDSDAISEHIEYCSKNQVDYLRLGFPYLGGKTIDTIYEENDVMTKYALCLQAAIWKKSKLESILLENWSGWDFEGNIQKYIKDNGLTFRVLGLRKRFAKNKGLNYVTGTAVRKGIWTRAGYDFLKAEGFDELLSKRGQEGWLFYHLQQSVGILRVPCLALVRVMKYLKWNF